MSDRERWTVYPLLLLAIGLAMGNRLALQEEGHGGEADVIKCKGLEVVGPQGKPTVSISTSENGTGLLEVGDAQGQLQSRLSANPSGATLELLDHTGKIYTFIGHYADRFGLFAGDTNSSRVLSLISFATHLPAREQKKTPEGEPKADAPDNAADGEVKSTTAENPSPNEPSKPRTPGQK